jgi:integrase
MSGNTQALKVEQEAEDVGQILRFPNPDERRSLLHPVVPKTGTSPNKGHQSTGRNREHLTQSEIDKLASAAKATAQNGHRNYCAILLGYRHGLRVSEIAGLKWSDIDFDRGTVYLHRAKGSTSGTHPLQGDELRALRKLQREYPDSPFLFVGRGNAPLDARAIAGMIKRLGKGSKLLGFPVHAHMLRHTCGYLMCDRGYDLRIVQAWLGHANIQNTVGYTALSSRQFDKVSW